MKDRLNPAILNYEPPVNEIDPFEDFAGQPFYKRLNAHLVADLKLRLGQKVLDLACGPGNISVGIASEVGSGGLLVAADMLDVALQSTRLTLGNTQTPTLYVQATAENIGNVLDPLAGQFDAVVCGNAFHNFGDKQAAAFGIYKCLKPGGPYGFNMTFFDGAMPQNETSFYKAWLSKSRRAAVSESRRQGVDIGEKEKVEARVQLKPGDYCKMLENVGFSIVSLRVTPVRVPVEGFVAISKDPEFLAGSMHGFKPEIAKGALQPSVREVFKEQKKRYSVRNWLQMVAVK